MRLLGVVLVVLLAGCSGLSPSPSGIEETVTPVSVPNDTAGTDTDAVGIEEGRIDGPLLGTAHTASLAGAHTRVVDFDITTPDGIYLDYREARTVDDGGDMLRTREYAGPATARFLPDVSEASRARSQRYVADGEAAQLRRVDGVSRRVTESGPPPLQSPVPTTDDAGLVSALLANATVDERTARGGFRLTGNAVASIAVPEYLDGQRDVRVVATVRDDGRITRISVRYESTLAGDPVRVAHDVYWSPPAELVTPPEWYAE